MSSDQNPRIGASQTLSADALWWVQEAAEMVKASAEKDAVIRALTEQDGPMGLASTPASTHNHAHDPILTPNL